MYVRYVRIVHVMFLSYLSIYPVSTRVLAYCSYVRSLPPENDEGENESGENDHTRFYSFLFSHARLRIPPSYFKITEQSEHTNISLDSPPQPAPTLSVKFIPSYLNRTYPRTIPENPNIAKKACYTITSYQPTLKGAPRE